MGENEHIIIIEVAEATIRTTGDPREAGARMAQRNTVAQHCLVEFQLTDYVVVSYDVDWDSCVSELIPR